MYVLFLCVLAIEQGIVCLLVLPFTVCIRGYFHGGFIFENFASQTSRKFPLQFMSIHRNENIRKVAKLTLREFPHLAQNRENISVREYHGVYSINYNNACNFKTLAGILNFSKRYFRAVINSGILVNCFMEHRV